MKNTKRPCAESSIATKTAAGPNGAITNRTALTADEHTSIDLDQGATIVSGKDDLSTDAALRIHAGSLAASWPT